MKNVSFGILNKTLHLINISKDTIIIFSSPSRVWITLNNESGSSGISLPATLTKLIIENNDLATFSNFNFSSLLSLQEIRLSNNGLKTVPKFLNNLKKLKVLQIRNQNFTTTGIITRNGISLENTDLRSLRFINCGITFLEDFNLQNLQNLTIIDLSDNKIEIIRKINFPPDLRCLILRNNKIRHTRARVWTSLPNLEYLDLSWNRMKLLSSPPLPTSLVSLNLTHNHLEYITPNTFRNMAQLRWLDLSYCGYENLKNRLKISLFL